jgi:hypothetical protein
MYFAEMGKRDLCRRKLATSIRRGSDGHVPHLGRWDGPTARCDAEPANGGQVFGAERLTVKSMFGRLSYLYDFMAAAELVVGGCDMMAQLTGKAPARSEGCSGRECLRPECCDVRRRRL